MVFSLIRDIERAFRMALVKGFVFSAYPENLALGLWFCLGPEVFGISSAGKVFVFIR